MEDFIKSKINIKLSVRYSYNGCLYGVYYDWFTLFLYNSQLKNTLKKTSVKLIKDKYVICIDTQDSSSLVDLFLKDYKYKFQKEQKEIIINSVNNKKDIHSYFNIVLSGSNSIIKNRIYHLNNSILKIEIPIHKLTSLFNPNEIIAIKLLENKELNQDEIVIAEAINLKI